MTPVLDDADRRLLTAVQRAVPLTERPYASLAADLHTTESDVLSRVERLRNGPRAIIRQISAIFDTRALGYESTLVGAVVRPRDIERAAAAAAGHPGVTHCYQREHEYNLWYTLAVPPGSALGLARTVEILHRRSGAQRTRIFPALKVYKIGVMFDLTGDGDAAQPAQPAPMAPRPAGAAGPAAFDRAAVRVLQKDLPTDARPFDRWAQEAGMSLSRLLETARLYLEHGMMRRFAALVHHRRAGMSANCMVAWDVPAGSRDEFGRLASSLPAVSHCYERPTYGDWPYSVFTMVHARSRAECDAIIELIARRSGIGAYAALYSVREMKKTRLRFFDGRIEAWEAAAANS